MNRVYFACRTCKAFIDAAGSKSYWALEVPGLVARGEPVGVQQILEASDYWHADPDKDLLVKLLPAIRSFLEKHQSHDVTYGEDEDFLDFETNRFLEWMDDGPFVVDLSPRHFVDRMGYTQWQQVIDHVAKMKQPPWWWNTQLARPFQAKFEMLVKDKQR